MFVEVYKLDTGLSFTPSNEAKLEPIGLFNTNLILKIKPYDFGYDMKNITGNWYEVKLDNTKIEVLGYHYIDEKTYKKLKGDD